MLRIPEHLRALGADIVPIETRLAVQLSEESVEALLDFWSVEPPLHVTTADVIAWDLRRRFGDDGLDLYSLAAATLGHPRERGAALEARWAQFTRERLPSDRLLIDLMDDAEGERWPAPPEVRQALEALRDVADRNREALAAEARAAADDDEAKWQAAADAEHAAWLAEGASSDEIDQKMFAALQRAKVPQQMPMPTGYVPPGAAAVPLLGTQEVVADLGGPIVDGFLSSQKGQPAGDAPALPATLTAHPLATRLNLAIAHIVTMAERGPAAFRAAAVAEVLAVAAIVHEDTFKETTARIRGLGCPLPQAKVAAAISAFEARVQRELRSAVGWRLNMRGEPDPLDADNVAFFLRTLGAEVRWNDWRQRVEIRPRDCEWTAFGDADLNHLRAVASGAEHRFRPSKEFMRDMLIDLARSTTFDPVRDYVDTAEGKWDRVPRLSIWLTRACGVPCDLYHQAVGRNVIGGIVKRARRPGAKHDEVMILTGPQGCGKSTLAAVLAIRAEWFTDSVTFDGRPQDVVPQLFGKLVVELSELDGVHRRDVGFIKRFLSTQVDSFTAKYQAFSDDHPRRCIFIGTCNLDSPLQDETGNRRFLPVRVSQEIDTAWLRENLEQLIGEAAALETAGVDFGIPRDVWGEAAAHQESARTVSAVEELLMGWFDRQTPHGVAGHFITSTDLVAALIMAKQNSNAKVGRTMTRLGYQHRRPYIAGVQQRAWVKSPDGEIANCARLVPTQNMPGGVIEMRARM